MRESGGGAPILAKTGKESKKERRDARLTLMPSVPNSKWRVRIAFFCLFVFLVVFSVGAYFVADLRRLQEILTARESQAVLQGITDPSQIDEALRQHPSNKFLQMTAMATRAANDTDAAVEKLSNEVEPPGMAKNINLGTASSKDLEALRRDLKTAEANATTFMPRYAALLKTERDDVEKYALALHVDKDASRRFLDSVDKRHAEITAFTTKMLSARADFYRAYGNYVAVLVGEFGTYKVVNGQFIFPFQRTVNRYNDAASVMSAATKRVAELEGEKQSLKKSQQQRWEQFVGGK
jgi:hypothetical protein